MPEDTLSSDAGSGAPSPAASPICFVTEAGATITITLDSAVASANPGEAMVKAKDAIRCLADAFARAESRLSRGPDEAGAVFRSWAYRP